MRFTEAFRIKNNELLTLTGGGGKTSLMFTLGNELCQNEIKHIMTTSTKICLPEKTQGQIVMDIDLNEIIKIIKNNQELQWIAGKKMVEGRKIRGFSENELAFLHHYLYPIVILNEGDGAKMKPYKFYSHYEPVIPAVTTKLIHVIGAEVLDQKIGSDYFHRSEIFKGSATVFDEGVFEEAMHCFLKEKIEGLLEDSVSRILFINKAQGENLKKAERMGAIGKSIFDHCFIGSLKENWLREC